MFEQVKYYLSPDSTSSKQVWGHVGLPSNLFTPRYLILPKIVALLDACPLVCMLLSVQVVCGQNQASALHVSVSEVFTPVSLFNHWEESVQFILFLTDIFKDSGDLHPSLQANTCFSD